MARALYSPAQVAQIAERGRRDGWSSVRVEQTPGRIVIEFSDKRALDDDEDTIERWKQEHAREFAGS